MCVVVVKQSFTTHAASATHKIHAGSLAKVHTSSNVETAYSLNNPLKGGIVKVKIGYPDLTFPHCIATHYSVDKVTMTTNGGWTIESANRVQSLSTSENFVMEVTNEPIPNPKA